MKAALGTWDGLRDGMILLVDAAEKHKHNTEDENCKIFLGRFKDEIERMRSHRSKIEDFDIIETIGRGHFGEVNLVRRKDNRKVFAIKSMSKLSTLQQKSSACFEEERDIMARST
eukprot:UC4_evm1s525